jgi:DNA-binding CsgD family transcriptional regulator
MAVIPTFPASSTAPEIPVNRIGLPEFDAELAAASIAALDHLLVALILLGDEDEICHLNAAARRITEAGDGIQRCGRYLRFTNPFGRDNGPHGCDPDRIFRVRRPSGAPDYIVTVFPARMTSVGYRPVSSIMLITDPAAIQVCPKVLRRIWGLTAAEARVAASLAAGLSPAEIAVRHGVSEATVRTQMRTIFEKTGTHRQGELIRLLTSIGIAGASQD